MADYPVLDGAGGTIVENEVDPAYVATPYDNSGDYPVLDALGNVIVEGDNVFDEDAQTYISAVETADGEALEADVKTAIDNFVKGCKADGIWSALKASCILAGARTLSGALVPLVGAAPTNVNFVSGDYARKTGLKGDGSTKYLDSNRNNNADPQNDKHLCVYPTSILNNVDVWIGAGAFGSPGGITPSNIFASDTSTGRVFVNCGGDAGLSFTPAVGFIGASRDESASFDYRVGGATSTSAQASGTPLDANLFVFARNDTGATLYTADRIAFYSIGESLDLANLDTRLSTLMTAIDGAIA